MPTAFDIAPLMVDLNLLGVALLVLVLDLGMPHGRKRMLGLTTAILLFALFIGTFWMDASGSAFSGAYIGSAWTLMLKRIVLIAGALASLGSIDHVDRHFPNRQGEFYLLLLFTMLGMSILPGARDLILFVVCFELMGIPLSIMASYAKADDRQGVHKHAAEAGLKLYLVSAASTAITLFGLSLVYGLTASTKLSVIANAPLSPLLGMGMLMTLAGMSFKVGVVPFHMWIPDTYQGAPTPFVAFLSVAPKATGFAALAAVVLVAFRNDAAQLGPVLVLFIVASVVIGSVMALPQKDVKRLLGYSGIAQVGYMMMGLAAGGEYGTSMLLFYVAGYVVTNMGAFFVLEAVAPNRTGIVISDLNGLSKRSPWLALALLMFLLSLAGIPFVVGFWAKLYVFMAVYQAHQAWLVFFGALMAMVSLWYYLQVARAAFMMEPAPEQAGVKPKVGWTLQTAIALCLMAVVGMGAYPRPFLDGATAAARAFMLTK